MEAVGGNLGNSFFMFCMFSVLLSPLFCIRADGLSGDLDFSLSLYGMGGGGMFSLFCGLPPALSLPVIVSSVQLVLAMLSIRSLVVSIFVPRQ